ncbi:MAG TPA: hypothetical protein ENJ62_01010 [Bryobacterales bacterium]|nr:hypothetical protein [Bryobacterales bacterium]
MLLADADITTWLPGDIIYDGAVYVPAGMPPGDYELDLALVDPQSREPKIRLAIAGRRNDGWYPMGRIRVE